MYVCMYVYVCVCVYIYMCVLQGCTSRTTIRRDNEILYDAA